MSSAATLPQTEYEVAKQVAYGGPEHARAALAASATTRPELLYFLAGDQAPTVRAAVAANTATPAQADRVLAQDSVPEVRAVLGRKLAALAPGLSSAEQDRLGRLSWATLCALVEDATVQVRAAISDALKEMPDAPRALILRLARDAEMPVAEPVIRLSPMLTEDDLLALVTVPPVPSTVTAVARRPYLSETLSDAIVAHADAPAVTALLENRSAAIREATLDALIANASTHTAWQAPLVRRPLLSLGAARALGTIVTDQLLRALAARPDLDPTVTEELRARVAVMLAADAVDESPPESQFLTAAADLDRARMTQVLAEAAGVPEAVVEHAVMLRSAKGLVSLCWRAGFLPGSSVTAQTVLGQIALSAVLCPTEDQDWPLAPDQMSWQMELLTNAG